MRAFVERLWPRRLANQLTCLMVVALLLSNAVALLILQRTGELVHPLSRSLAIERLTTAYLLATHAPDAAGAQALAAMQDTSLRISIDTQPDVAPHAMRKEELLVSAALMARLAPPVSPTMSMPMSTAISTAMSTAKPPVMVQLERVSGEMARTLVLTPTGNDRLQLRTSIPLPDGRYLNVLQYPAVAYEWSLLLAYALPVSSIPLLLIVLWFVRRMVRPVKVLAEATERVSRGEWIAPLTLSGPKEARDLTQAFNVMQARIARHVESRTRMFAALSHDLNTPITEVRLQLELLDDTPLREDLLESLGELQAMIGATLDFMRGDVQHEPMVSASLDGLLNDLARRYRILGAPVVWHIQDRLACHCRPLALKRALTNLIDNALRHAGDAVVRLGQQADGSARIEILDHGKGIATARLDHVFEPFVQLNANAVNAGAMKAGLGLGLTIARSCIQAHGGELWLENRPPAGLCAVIVLPAAAQARTQKSIDAPTHNVRP